MIIGLMFTFFLSLFLVGAAAYWQGFLKGREYEQKRGKWLEELETNPETWSDLPTRNPSSWKPQPRDPNRFHTHRLRIPSWDDRTDGM